MSRRFVLISISFLFVAITNLAARGVETLEIKNIQSVRTLAAVVHDRSGFPFPGVLVEERTSDWKLPLRSTTTDDAGNFVFSPVQGRDIYYLLLSRWGFNPLRVRVKVDPKRGKALILEMELST